MICFALQRSRDHDDPARAKPTATTTRWRVSALPSPPPPPLTHAPDTPGPARARRGLELLRCRRGEPATWIVGASAATGHLDLPADVANRPVAAAAGRPRAVAG
jgi:protein ImuA